MSNEPQASQASWIAFKGRRQEEEFWDLAHQNLRMFSVVATAAALHYGTTGTPLVVTSIYRPGKITSVHAHWRGTDARIFHPDREVPEGQQGAEEDEAQVLCDLLNELFEYPGHDTAIIHGDGLDRHIHIQVAGGLQWKA